MLKRTKPDCTDGGWLFMHLKNENYCIRVVYTGDLKTEQDLKYLTVDFKALKPSLLPIVNLEGEFLIDMDYFCGLMKFEELEQIYQQVQVAKQTVDELKVLLAEYFPVFGGEDVPRFQKHF